MKRREFLMRIGGAMVAVPSVLVMTSACGGGDDGAPDAGSATSFTISSDGDHIHMLTVQCADLGNTGGVTYTSTEVETHSHMVTLSAADLATIAGGGSVTITTDDLAHTHNWTIAKPSSACISA